MQYLHEAAAGGNDLTASVRFQHQTNKLYALGPRPMGEMLARLVRLHPEIEGDLLAMLDDYSHLDGAFLQVAGLDRWPHVLIVVPDAIKAGTADKALILARSLAPGRGPDGAA